MVLARSRPPTWKEDLQQLVCKTAPGSIFGLVIYTIQLLRGAVASELRRSIGIAVVLGWVATALIAVSFPAFHLAFSPAMSMAHLTTGAIVFTSLVMIMAGSLIYNRVTYGSYL